MRQIPNPMEMKPRYVFLDRDGVINRKIAGGYVNKWKDFEFLPGALDALRLLHENGYKPLVVSNQAAVGKGTMSARQLAGITRRFLEQVRKHGGRIHGVYYCMHKPDDDCNCRKPNAGLLLKAQREHGLLFQETYLVGDSPSDAAVADVVGCPFVRVASDGASGNEPWTHTAAAIVPSLAEAVNFVLSSRFAGPQTTAR
jgi:histidinol-phosphate phosphatase family protein